MPADGVALPHPHADGAPSHRQDAHGPSPSLDTLSPRLWCRCPAMRQLRAPTGVASPSLRFSSTRVTTDTAEVATSTPSSSLRQRPFVEAPAPTDTALCSSHGLAGYFHGLAAGDEMSELVRSLRASMWMCYQDCHRGVLSRGAGSIVQETELTTHIPALTSLTSTAEGETAPALSAPPQPRGNSEGDVSADAHAAATAPAAHVPTVPAPLPSGTLRAAERRQYWTATKAALLFAAESPAAAEEATVLHCSAVARSVLYQYYFPSADGSGHGSSSDATGAATSSSSSASRRRQAAAAAVAGARGGRTATSDGTPAMSTLQPSDVRWVLSDTCVVELAKAALRGDGNNKDGWERALALLRQVEPTPLTSAVELQLYRRTDGQHWAAALACLWRIPPARWTEMDVSAAVRSLYAVGRRHGRECADTRPGAASAFAAAQRNTGVGDGGGTAELTVPSPASLFLTRLTAQALRIHSTVATASAMRWGAPSAFNDTLGLVALDAAGWQDACALLDQLLAGAREAVSAELGGDAVLAAEARQEMCAPPSGLTEAAVAPAPAPLPCVVAKSADVDSDEVVSVFFESAAPAASSFAGTDAHIADASATGALRTAASPASSLYAHVRANAVTLHQTCRAFRARWDVGLRYVELLHDAFGDTLGLVTDTSATEDVLRLCIAGQRWETALQLVTAHQNATTTATAVPTRNGAACTADEVEPRGRPAARATLPQHRPHYHPHVFVELVRLLGSAAASRSTACDLIRRYTPTTDPASAGAFAPPVPLPVSDAEETVRSSLRASKHYNTNTLSRAYNCLVQNAEDLADADAIIAQLQRGSATQAEKGRVHEQQAGVTAEAVSVLDGQLAGLETESVAHVAFLSAVAGDWQRALHHTNALLHEPRYSTTFFPTARLHDAVQYALEQAPPPGAPWQVSLHLFADMMERNVPSSEVSFQSAVKRCFAGGVPEQAQKLFYFTLRRGVR